MSVQLISVGTSAWLYKLEFIYLKSSFLWTVLDLGHYVGRIRAFYGGVSGLDVNHVITMRNSNSDKFSPKFSPTCYLLALPQGNSMAAKISACRNLRGIGLA